MCPSCKSTHTVGKGELATCANPACAKFVQAERDAVEQAFDRARAGLTDAERATEQSIRERSFAIPRLLDMEDLNG